MTLDETLGSLGELQKNHQETSYKPYKLLNDLKKREPLNAELEFGPCWAERRFQQLEARGWSQVMAMTCSEMRFNLCT